MAQRAAQSLEGQERTHFWFSRFRRLLMRWEKRTANYEAMLHLAGATITAGQAGLFG